MKAISLHGPWAQFVIWEWKPIETRLHERFKGLVGQTIIIHATKELKYLKEGSFLNYMNKTQKKRFYEMNQYFQETAGKLLGTVRVVGFRKLIEADSYKAMIYCGLNNRYGLILENPRLFKEPYPYKGHQGIFNVPPEIMKELNY